MIRHCIGCQCTDVAAAFEAARSKVDPRQHMHPNLRSVLGERAWPVDTLMFAYWSNKLWRTDRPAAAWRADLVTWQRAHVGERRAG